jgi:hypothetical protein
VPLLPEHTRAVIEAEQAGMADPPSTPPWLMVGSIRRPGVRICRRSDSRMRVRGSLTQIIRRLAAEGFHVEFGGTLASTPEFSSPMRVQRTFLEFFAGIGLMRM